MIRSGNKQKLKREIERVNKEREGEEKKEIWKNGKTDNIEKRNNKERKVNK